MRSSGWEQVAALNTGPRFDRGQELSGKIVAGRFRVGPLSNVGGMGFVYAAEDLARAGAPVAFKVMLPISRSGDESRERFFREAEVLSSLRHPGIVEYVAHGLTEDERPYLVMEWLAGEELEKTLARQHVTMNEALVMLRKIADALAFAHDRGITHRDLKPSNIILRDGRVDDPAVLDFGVARWLGHTMQVTRTGMLVGTPGYMAPEQARGQTDIGPAADVFALGCLLYQCLVGKPPFTGDHITAVLAKVLFEEVPPIRNHRTDLPPALDALVMRMLLKNPADRPQDARALLAELDTVMLETSHLQQHVSTVIRKAALTDKELALYCLVLAAPERTDDGDAWVVSNSTIRAPFIGETAWPLKTLERLGVQLESMADGSVAIVVGKGASAKEQAATATRCALLLFERNPTAQIILVTGRGVLGPHGGVHEGEVFARASALLRERALASMAEPVPTGISIDEITASVLGPGYDMERGATSIVLTNIVGGDQHQSSLGHALSCIGREREIGQLLSSLDGVIEDERGAAVIVTSPPGMGKSRLLHAFLDRVRHDRGDVAVLHGLGDPSHTNSPYGVIARALRELAGVQTREIHAEQRRKLEARLGAFVPKTNLSSAVLPLVDLCVSLDESSDAPTHDSAVESAFLMWLAAECAAHPTLLAVDDSHWADDSSLRLLDQVLRSTQNMPLFVVTIHRVAGETHAPLPWQGRAQELRLSGIGKRAAERFVRSVLGNDTLADTVTRLVHDAGGNPLFLEELVRAELAGHRDTTSETLLAILQARMQHLSIGARRALRAASLFGPTFWKRGVVHLLGLDKHADDESVSRWLEELLDAELVALHPESRFADDTEYGFSSGHVRDAAYGLLTDGDRDLGRKLVGLFLDQVG